MPLSLFDIIKLAGGLALFLYGMSMLGSGLEKASGGQLERTMEKLTGNLAQSVLLGAGVTALIQSSSAATVITVGLVNAGIIKLRQAIGIIMGANIGTTITAHILRLSDLSDDNFFLQFVKPETLAPLVAVIGIVLFMMPGKTRRRQVGEIMLGFGILFSGMFAMESAVSGLSESPQIASLFTAFGNNIPLGILTGALVTALIQSSSASVGILQALSTTGAITFSAAIPIILGQNIGTCITAILASIGTTKNAKRTAIAHLYFNIIGVLVFVGLFYGANYFFKFGFLNEIVDKGGIANFHTLFNVCATLFFLPFSRLLEKLATISVKSDGTEIDTDISALDQRFLSAPGLAIEQAQSVLIKMAALTRENLVAGLGLLKKYDTKVADRMKEAESAIDRMEDHLRNYLLTLHEGDLGAVDSLRVSSLLQMTGEFERIGDYADNIREYAEGLWTDNEVFTEKAAHELDYVGGAVIEILDAAILGTKTCNARACTTIEPLEDVIDEMVELVRANHIERLRRGECIADVGSPYVETLLNLERVADHCSNIGVCLAAPSNGGLISQHEFVRRLHKGATEHFTEKYITFRDKYYNPLLDE